MSAALLLLALSGVEGLLALQQPGPQVEKSGLFEYTRPEGWTREPIGDGSYRLSPPGGGTTVVRFLNPEAWSGSAEDYHLAVLRVIRVDGDLLSGGKPEPFGAFLRSESVIGKGKTPLLWIRLYTAKVDKLWQAAFYAGVTSDGFERHAAAADGILRSVVLPGGRQRTASFDFALPASWKRQDVPDRDLVLLLPRGLADGKLASLTILPSRESPATVEEHHELMWRVLTENGIVVAPLERGETGVFRTTRSVLKNRADELVHIALYSAVRAGRAETLVFNAASRELWEQHRPQADGLVAGIQFAPVAAPAASLPPPAWAPAPLPARDVKLAGVWVHASSKPRFGFDPEGFGTRVRSEFLLLALWENGVAYTGSLERPLTAAPGGQREGLAVIDAAALAERAAFADPRYSRWTGRSDGVVVGGLELAREGANLKGPQGELWVAVPPVDGAVLDGVYTARSEGQPEMTVTFRLDGTFEAVNLNFAMGGPEANPGFPAKGKGTYEFRKGSLLLRFVGGWAQSLHVWTGTEPLRTAKGLILGGAAFERR
jgi:hypothetical protein